MPVEVLDNVVSFRFVVTFLLVLGGFAPLGFSIWKTYQADRKQKKD